jgi:hypothetical protein
MLKTAASMKGPLAPWCVSAVALALLVSCGGAGTENLAPDVDADASVPIDDSSLVDGSVEDASDAISVVDDASSYDDWFGTFDRTTRDRPPAKVGDAGPTRPPPDAPVAPNDSGTPNPDGVAPPEMDGGHLDTRSILAAQSPALPGDAATSACLACAEENGCLDPAQQGGGCETVPDRGAALDGGEAGTDAFQKEAPLCLRVLAKIFATKCAATLEETPCICGSANSAQCLAGNVTATGPVYPDYVEDFGTESVPTIMTSFTNPTFGAGRANALVGCVAAYGCDCFGTSAAGDGG